MYDYSPFRGRLANEESKQRVRKLLVLLKDVAEDDALQVRLKAQLSRTNYNKVTLAQHDLKKLLELYLVHETKRTPSV